MFENLIFLNTFILALAFYVAMIFLKYYQLSKIPDFAILTLIYFGAFFAVVSSNSSMLFQTTFWFQATVFFLNTTIFLIFIYAVFLHPPKWRKWLVVIASTWYSILATLLLFWEKFDQPDTANVLFIFNLRHTRSDAHPIGAGLKIITENGETIIYSTSHQILGILFWIFCFSISFYSVSRIKIPKIDNREVVIHAQKVKKSLIIQRIMELLWATSLLPIFPPSIPDEALGLFNAFILISLTALAVVVLTYPEGMAITDYQFSRTFAAITKAVQVTPEFLTGTNSYFLDLVTTIEQYDVENPEKINIVDIDEPYGFFIIQKTEVRFAHTFKKGFDSLLVSNFVAAFFAFANEVFYADTPAEEKPIIQRSRNGIYEVFGFLNNGLIFAYLYKGISLTAATKIRKISNILLSKPQIKEYISTNNPKVDKEIHQEIKSLIIEVLEHYGKKLNPDEYQL